MSEEDQDWHKVTLKRLKERKRRETDSFKDIIIQNNQLVDKIAQLEDDNLQYTYEIGQLRAGIDVAQSGASSSETARLKEKISKLQEDLTELATRKYENAQMVVDMKIQLDTQRELLKEKEAALTEQFKINTTLKADYNRLDISLQQLKEINTKLHDEYTALKLSHTSLDVKMRKIQEDNRNLLDHVMKYQAKDAEKLNEENETFLKKKSDKVRRDLEEAARENRRSSSPISVSSDWSDGGSVGEGCSGGAPTKLTGFYSDATPNTVHVKFDAHDGEVNAVRWSPVGRLVATGGADRKVKLWDVGKNIPEMRSVFVGSNAAVNSVDFDSTGSIILSTSNDFASRVWSISDCRLKHTLTGHSGKVMAAKFMGEPTKVVTGSHDKTLKIWDLMSRACIETKFAGSTCYDLVTTDSSGSMIISGHYDKKIRFWDARTNSTPHDILMSGKITSLDLSKDCRYLLACVRDDTIKLIDLRNNQIILSYSHENFKVGCDWARVAFSADAKKIAAGSADGTIYIWDTNGRLAAELKDHTTAITAVSWHPYSSGLASVDRGKNCTIWLDA